MQYEFVISGVLLCSVTKYYRATILEGNLYERYRFKINSFINLWLKNLDSSTKSGNID